MCAIHASWVRIATFRLPKMEISVFPPLGGGGRRQCDKRVLTHILQVRTICFTFRQAICVCFNVHLVYRVQRFNQIHTGAGALIRYRLELQSPSCMSKNLT